MNYYFAEAENVSGRVAAFVDFGIAGGAVGGAAPVLTLVIIKKTTSICVVGDKSSVSVDQL